MGGLGNVEGGGLVVGFDEVNRLLFLEDVSIFGHVWWENNYWWREG